MKFTDRKFVKFLQEGGMAPEPAPEEAAPAPEQAGGSPEEQIVMACQQALETQNCELALQVCQAILQMLGGTVGNGPQASQGSAPVYKKGGKLSKWVKK